MPHLPSGTVAFLFTDIEGSTALWERGREAMEVAVKRRIEILRQAITACQGVLYKTIGDGSQSAFPAAAAAPRLFEGMGARAPSITGHNHPLVVLQFDAD
jgi:class 3 adenylate cyclase